METVGRYEVGMMPLWTRSWAGDNLSYFVQRVVTVLIPASYRVLTVCSTLSHRLLPAPHRIINVQPLS